MSGVSERGRYPRLPRLEAKGEPAGQERLVRRGVGVFMLGLQRLCEVFMGTHPRR